MRIVFVGATETVVRTAEILLRRGHEVVIIEADKERIESLSDWLDCSFLHGDGSKPQILRETGPEQTDVLFCLSDDDKANIIASLVGRSLGFKRTVPSIQDPEYRKICDELDLEDTINPSYTIARYLADMAAGIDIFELSTVIKGEARFFSFTVDKDAAARVGELDLPKEARVVCYYRDDAFRLADEDTRLKAGDRAVILTHSRNLAELEERWKPRSSNGNRQKEKTKR